MNLIKSGCLYITLCLFFSCVADDNKQISQTREQSDTGNYKKQYPEIFTNDSLRNNYINKLIDNGDTLVYRQMYKDYLTTGRGYEFLSYAVIMANKHEYAPAYLDVYQLLGLNQKDKTYLNKIKKQRQYYLLKAYELKDKSAVYHIKKEFGNNYDSIKLVHYMNAMETMNNYK